MTAIVPTPEPTPTEYEVPAIADRHPIGMPLIGLASDGPKQTP